MSYGLVIRLLCIIASVFSFNNAWAYLSNSVRRENIKNDTAITADPPFSGTIFIAPGIITPSDTSVFQQVFYEGMGIRAIFGRADNKWEDKEVYLFQADYSNGRPKIEIQVDTAGFVNPDTAMSFAKKYGAIIGRLPVILRSRLQTVTIRRGMYAFGGGSHNLLIYTDYEKRYYERQGIVEETLVHETTHISLDPLYSHSPEWLAAQRSDGIFISAYARDNPNREDMAESFLLYMAVHDRPDRIPRSLAETIKKTIPNRIRFFEGRSFEMSPVE